MTENGTTDSRTDGIVEARCPSCEKPYRWPVPPVKAQYNESVVCSCGTAFLIRGHASPGLAR